MWTPRDQQVSDSGEPLILCSDRAVVVLCAAVGVLRVVRCPAEEAGQINPDRGFVAAAQQINNSQINVSFKTEPESVKDRTRTVTFQGNFSVLFSSLQLGTGLSGSTSCLLTET